MNTAAYLVKISIDGSIQYTLTVSFVHHYERFNLKKYTVRNIYILVSQSINLYFKRIVFKATKLAGSLN